MATKSSFDRVFTVCVRAAWAVAISSACDVDADLNGRVEGEVHSALSADAATGATGSKPTAEAGGAGDADAGDASEGNQGDGASDANGLRHLAFDVPGVVTSTDPNKLVPAELDSGSDTPSCGWDGEQVGGDDFAGQAAPPTTGGMTALVILVTYDFDGDGDGDCPSGANPYCDDVARLPPDAAERAVFTNPNSLAAYLKTASFDAVTSLTGVVTERIVLPRLSREPVCGTLPETYDAAMARYVENHGPTPPEDNEWNPDNYDYVIVQQPYMSCGGLGGLGGGGSAWINGGTEAGIGPVLIHEVGHAMGLNHSSSLLCSRCPTGDFEPIVFRDVGVTHHGTVGSSQLPITDFTTCHGREYGDNTSVMGAGGGSPHFTSLQKESLGWLARDAGALRTITLPSGDATLDGYERNRPGVKAARIPIGGVRSYTLELRDQAADPVSAPFGARSEWLGLRLYGTESSLQRVLDATPQCDAALGLPFRTCTTDSDCESGQSCVERGVTDFCEPNVNQSAFWRAFNGQIPPRYTFIDPDEGVAINYTPAGEGAALHVSRRSGNTTPSAALASPADGAMLTGTTQTLRAIFHDVDGYECACRAGECADPALVICNDPQRDVENRSQSGRLSIDVFTCDPRLPGCTVPWRTSLTSSSLTDGEAFSFEVSGLDLTRTYYWRANAIDAQESTGTSPVFSFQLNMPPERPTAMAPISRNSNERFTRSVVFEAGPFTNLPLTEGGAIEFEVCASSSCATAVARARIPTANGMSASWPFEVAANFRYMFWRARAIDDAGQASPFTTVNWFLVDEVDPCESWATLPSMADGLANHTATLLSDGRLLVAGGFLGLPRNGAQIYDPRTNRWSARMMMKEERSSHTATLLRNGKVLIVGGGGTDPDNWPAPITHASVELFDPITGRFSFAAPMDTARQGHVANLLPDGRVIVSGGFDTDGALTIDTAQIFDPATGWTPSFPLEAAHAFHAAVPLDGGAQLWLAGSEGGRQVDRVATSAPYASSGDIDLPQAMSGHSATALYSGWIFVAGSAADAQLFLPRDRSYAPVGAFARRNHSATLLPSGKVLLTGGRMAGDIFQVGSVIYPGMTETALFPPRVGSTYGTERERHTATLMPNGRALVVGGKTWSGASGTRDAFSYRSSCGRLGPVVTGIRGAGTRVLATPLSRSERVLVIADNGSRTSELYHAASRTFVAGPMLTSRHTGITSTLLTTGQVLIVGDAREAEVFEEGSERFREVGALVIKRSNHSATLLETGEVMIAGGDSRRGVTDVIEIYHPGEERFVDSTLRLVNARAHHTATLLTDGRVLIVGGVDDRGDVIDSAELVDLDARDVYEVEPLTGARSGHSATLLLDGSVLVAGGDDGGAPLSSAALFDGATESWTALGDADGGGLVSARSGQQATLLLNGDVVISGGRGAGDAIVTSVELFEPATQRFIATGLSLNAARARHGAATVQDGTVVLFGGDSVEDDLIQDAEPYDDGRGHSPTWRPRIDRVTGFRPGPGCSTPLCSAGWELRAPTRLRIDGSQLTGLSEASSGNTQSSASNNPVIHLVRIDNGQELTLAADDWSATRVEAPLPADFANGVYHAYVVTNGIPSKQRPWTHQWPPFAQVVIVTEGPGGPLGGGVGELGEP